MTLSSHWLPYLQGRLGKSSNRAYCKKFQGKGRRDTEGTAQNFLTIFFLHFSGEGNRSSGSHFGHSHSQRIPDLVFEPMLSDSRTGALSHAIIVPRETGDMEQQAEI